MEAKDTVMNENEIADVLLGIPVSNTDVDIKHRREAIQKVVQAQAEISHKEGRAEGRKEGKIEVVEWLERTKKIKVPKYQLKEWGL